MRLPIAPDGDAATRDLVGDSPHIPTFARRVAAHHIIMSSIFAPCPLSHRRLEDFDLHKELYRGKSSLLYMATDKLSGQQVALKLYRKRKLSTLNRSELPSGLGGEVS